MTHYDYAPFPSFKIFDYQSIMFFTQIRQGIAPNSFFFYSCWLASVQATIKRHLTSGSVSVRCLLCPLRTAVTLHCSSQARRQPFFH